MTGYKSKVAMTVGRAPDVSMEGEQTLALTWQERLKKVLARSREKYGYGNNLDVVSDCMDYMQLHFPGNYTLVWKLVSPNEFGLVPEFKEPKHETMWKLKYT
jgi:hypothetical protein